MKGFVADAWPFHGALDTRCHAAYDYIMDTGEIQAALTDIRKTSDEVEKSLKLAGLVGTLFAAKGWEMAASKEYGISKEFDNLRSVVSKKLSHERTKDRSDVGGMDKNP
jgi:hypothetical protein